MSFAQFIVIPIFISIQAFVLMLITPYVPFTTGVLGAGLLTWVSFQAWAMYFLGGCTVKMGLKTIAGYIGGIIASIAIFELGDLFAQAMGVYWGYAIAVFIVVIPVISAEKIPGLDFIPSWFIGAGVFFAFMSLLGEQLPHTLEGYRTVAVPELVACVVGLIFGYVTVTFRTRYEDALAPSPVDSDS